MQIEFELFRERVMRASENCGAGGDSINGDRPPIIEVHMHLIFEFSVL